MTFQISALQNTDYAAWQELERALIEAVAFDAQARGTARTYDQVAQYKGFIHYDYVFPSTPNRP
jgi:hypothetical protein